MNTKKEHGKIDWMITLVPLAIVIALCVLFFFVPEQSNAVLSQIRFFFGDTFGTYYLVIGLGIFILSLYIAGSKYGNIVLGEQNEKPKYSFFAWGSMMLPVGLLQIFCSIRSQNGYCMQLIHIWQRWGVFRIGQAYILCSIGVLFHGDSIWYWPLHLALCFM